MPSVLEQWVSSLSWILFQDRTTKELWLSEFLVGDHNSLVFDCGFHSYFKGTDVITGLRDFDDLVNQLKDLLISKKPMRVFSNLIIDDLSIYYWTLKQSNYNNLVQSYGELLLVLNQIRSRFHCNVMVLNWDICFENGYNFSSTPESLTYLPASIKSLLSHLIHYTTVNERLIVHRYINDKWVREPTV